MNRPSAVSRRQRDLLAASGLLVHVTHGREVGDQLGELRLVADRVAADHRIADTGPIRQSRGAGRAEVMALARLHGKRSKRVRAGGIDQRPHAGQIFGSRMRRRRPHQCPSRTGYQNLTEQICDQHVGSQSGEQK